MDMTRSQLEAALCGFCVLELKRVLMFSIQLLISEGMATADDLEQLARLEDELCPQEGDRS